MEEHNGSEWWHQEVVFFYQISSHKSPKPTTGICETLQVISHQGNNEHKKKRISKEII
jgi:hypothetical protein